MSPLDAARVLADMDGANRPTSPTGARGLAEAMRQGRWLVQPHGIVFDRNRRLIDGRHRMVALASLAKVAPELLVPMHVSVGADPRAFLVMDQGRKRRMADHLATAGLVDRNHKAVASALTQVAHYDRFAGTGLAFPTHSGPLPAAALVECVERSPAALERLIDCVEGYRAGPAIRARAAIAAAHFLGREAGVEDVDGFFYRLASAENLEPGSPELTLHRRAVQATNSGVKIGALSWLLLLVRALNAAHHGEPWQKAVLRPRGKAAAMPLLLDLESSPFGFAGVLR